MPVKIGFVGAGGIAGNHFGNLEQIPEASIVAVYDPDAARVAAACRRFPSAIGFESFEEMMRSATLDALYVCVPPFAHQDYEVQAARKGVHLLVEKPIGLDMARVREIQSAIDSAGIISSVGYHWRYMDTTARAAEALHGKQIGLALGYWIGGMPRVVWWRVRGQSGGQAVEQTTHIFDLMRYLLGEVESVYAAGSAGLMVDWPSYDIEDASIVTMRLRSGAVASMTSGDIAPRGTGTVGLQVYARDLVVSVMNTGLKISTPYRTEETLPAVNAYLAEDSAFVAAVASGDPSPIRSSYADAVRTLELTLAASESMAAGRTITIGD
jgi:myo-inositol 2-dehydrogenase / D-chiro-inositol 1-dehydrogenase